MVSSEITQKQNNNLKFKNIEVERIEHNNKHLFIVLDNGQKMLIVDNKIYDVSEYEHFVDYFEMNNKKYAVLKKWYLYLVNLETMEVVFKDTDAYAIFKNDENTLKILMNSTGKKIFNIETQEYLPMLDGYEYDDNLGNGLYVFRKKDLNEDIYTRKRYIVNLKGKIILKDIEGFIDTKDNKLIITRRDEIGIIEFLDNQIINTKTIKKGGNVLANPQHYNDTIISVEKDGVKIYDLNLVEIKRIEIDNLTKVQDVSWNGDSLWLIVPYQVNNETKYKRIFVGLKTGNVVSHKFLEGYPYWTPTTFIGSETNDEKLKDYYFYDKDLNFICKMKANACACMDDEDENIFLLQTIVDSKVQKTIYNSKYNTSIQANYDYIQLNHFKDYGYGINKQNETMDFFDFNLNIIIPNFKYKEFGLKPMLIYDEFSYHIINDYICITKHFSDDWGRSRYRTILYKANGQLLLDSIVESCYPIGKFFQITGNGNNRFLNTETGEIGNLVISAIVDLNGKIDFNQLQYTNNLIKIGNNIPRLEEHLEEHQKILKYTFDNKE